MLTNHSAHHSAHQSIRRHVERTSWIDWAAQLRLALVLSIAAVIVVVGLGDRLSTQALTIGVFITSSAVAWHRMGPVERIGIVPSRIRRR